MNGVGRVQGLTVQPVLVPIFKLYKNRCVGFFLYKRIIDIDNNGKGIYDSNLNNWTRIIVL